MSTQERADDIADELIEQAGVSRVRTAGGEVVEMDAKAGLEALKAIEARAARRSGKRRVITSINLGGTR
jgi:uncharacterized protein YqgV (UPF0045/DUF77 family)